VKVTCAPTSGLDLPTLADVRVLLTDAFGERFTEQDWQHACGGLHALVWLGSELIGHGSVVPRRFLYRGRMLRTGYVEAVAVRRDQRRQGHGAALMGRLEDVLHTSYELGALSSSVEAESFYASRSWRAWEGPLSVSTPHGVEEAEPERELYVFVPRADSIYPSDRLTCDWREGDLW